MLAFTIYKKKKRKKAVCRALFLTGDYNAESQKSKELPWKSKNYKVPHKHDA
jgi:hypothetical protein